MKASIITAAEYVGPVIQLCMEKRGQIKNQVYLTADRVELQFDMPLAEIVFDFFDKLKTISRGYASLDYELKGFQQSHMVRLDIMLNGEPVDALSAVVHRDKAYEWGKRLCEKLRELVPRQMFEIAIQAAIGQKIIARETIKALRKNVLAKCYGGDISRKRKLLEKQKKGKKANETSRQCRGATGGIYGGVEVGLIWGSMFGVRCSEFDVRYLNSSIFDLRMTIYDIV